MARIVYSALVESIRGSIGGTTFQKNAYGYTVKKKPNIIVPNTGLQTNIKNILSIVTRAWNGLTSAKRAEYVAWASTYPQYAKHNPSSQLSGYAVFVKYNCLRVLGGSPVFTSTLQAPPAADTLSYEVENNVGALAINITSADDSEEWQILFFVSRVFKSTQNFIGTATRFISLSSNATQSEVITTPYTALYGGVPAVGDFVAVDALLIGDNSPKVLARDSQVYQVVAP